MSVSSVCLCSRFWQQYATIARTNPLAAAQVSMLSRDCLERSDVWRKYTGPRDNPAVMADWELSNHTTQPHNLTQPRTT